MVMVRVWAIELTIVTAATGRIPRVTPHRFLVLSSKSTDPFLENQPGVYGKRVGSFRL